ncbi:serine protease [Mycoplasmoides gallisepticum]
MNEILKLRVNFSDAKPNPVRASAANIPKYQSVDLKKIEDLKNDLNYVIEYWNNVNQSLPIKPLINIHYKELIAKSNRIKGLLENSSQKNNESVVGAKFSDDDKHKHIITHCVKKKVLVNALKRIQNVIYIFKKQFKNKITHDDIIKINSGQYNELFNNDQNQSVSKSSFINIIVDAYYVEKISVQEKVSEIARNNGLITIYKTGYDLKKLLNHLGLDILDSQIIDETTLMLEPRNYEILRLKAPQLISMAVSDISLIDNLPSIGLNNEWQIKIDDPKDEPIIGVIDTLFDKNVYFSKWVEYEEHIPVDITKSPKDYFHGTAVSSIIVDGPSFNKKELNDGCGRFRVKHFGVALADKFNTSTLMRKIEEIVKQNKHKIKVWNLSLGSAHEINNNFISWEGSILDKIQYEHDVIFVVAGTNKHKKFPVEKIGAPADSINSLIVNSVDHRKNPSIFSRRGKVLSFFNKPDISYYGEAIRTCTPIGEDICQGTSFAAPWITRKLAYLIYVLDFSIEEAKALIIDSAIKWPSYKQVNKDERETINKEELIGYGVVPIKIDDIVKTATEDIKIVISGVAEEFNTYFHNIPIPHQNNQQPFIARATLCYLTKCSRNQGVDYTDTELDFKFGQVRVDKNENERIDDLKKNKQSEDKNLNLREKKVRSEYRKWDNVKHISETLYTPKGYKKKPRNGTNSWGISIKKKNRSTNSQSESIKFGLVITLKEINGLNKINDFLNLCQMNNLIVHKVNIKKHVDIKEKAKEDINFE